MNFSTLSLPNKIVINSFITTTAARMILINRTYKMDFKLNINNQGLAASTLCREWLNMSVHQYKH